MVTSITLMSALTMVVVSAEDENFRNAYFQAAMAIKLDNKYCGGPKKFLLDHDFHLQYKGCNPNSVVDYWVGRLSVTDVGDINFGFV